VEGGCCLWVVGVSGQLSSFVPVLCCCSWARGMGAPCFSCAVVPVSCRGGQSSFVGGWSERSSSLVDFRGLWVVSFVGGQGFALMVGGSCRLWAVVPVLCGGWSWFMVHGLLGWTTHVVSGSAVVVRGWSYPFRTVVGGGCGWVCPSSFVGSDRGEVIVVCGWLVRVTRGFKTHEKPGKTREPVSRVRVRLGLQIPNPNPHPPPPAMPTRTGLQTRDIP
jgi:hypothetical protein